MIAPKLRFKEFDGDWSALKYKDVLTIKYGKDHKSLDEGDIPVYGTGGVMRYVDQYLYEGESILIGRKGTIDQPKYVNEKFWTVDTLFYTEIKKNALPLFLFQHALQVNWLGLNEATGVPSLNTTSINNVDIYLPSNEEQTKIASFLSAVDEKISQLNRKHELLSQYKQGMMQKLFSQQIRFKADDGSEFGEWVEWKFESCIDIFDNLRKPVSASERKTGSTPYYGANGIQSYIDGYTHDGEFILIAEDGANDLINYPIQYVNGKIWVNNHAHVVCGKTKIAKNIFLKYRLGSIDFTKYLVGGGRAKLNAGAMKEISLLLPCLAEQTKIANFLTAIDQKIEVVAQQIEQAKQWKKGLLQQMFV
ncbi:restriction endonuclease subunit S [Acinetobacter junii]|jgi:type I restriction enzyme S subunit|uniref:restriction endonuclease subunit S n=1 Tax=Acinetobacter junii TaxID=40215 RepID=UPI0032B5E19F